MTPKQFMKKYNLTKEQFCGKKEISGSLDLGSLTSIPEGFNPTVGGWLDLGSLTSIPEGFNPTVGGWLNLGSLTSIPEGFNPTVGGWLDLGSNLKRKVKINPLPANFNTQHRFTVESSLTWQNGKYRVFDGVFCEVIRKLKNAFKVKIEGKINYVVTDGFNYSHGATIKEAKKSLIYKISDRDTSQYQNMTLDTVISKEEAIKMYRVITGACEFGTKHFVSGLAKVKSKYKISEIIKLTAGQYGAETFRKFFEEK